MFLKVILRRLFTFIPTILGIATFAFILGHATPGDPAYAALGVDLDGYSGVDLEEVERVRKELGLDKTNISSIRKLDLECITRRFWKILCK